MEQRISKKHIWIEAILGFIIVVLTFLILIKKEDNTCRIENSNGQQSITSFNSVSTALNESYKYLDHILQDSYYNLHYNLQQIDLLNNRTFDSLYTIALVVKELSNDTRNYIDSIKYDFIGTKVAANVNYSDPHTKKEWNLILRDESGKAIIENVEKALDSIGFVWLNEKQLKDDHSPVQYFIGPDVKNPDPNLAAIQIKKKILDFKRNINEVLDHDSIKIQSAMKYLNLTAEYNKKGELIPWEIYNFNDVNTGAALVTLTRMKAEIIMVEYAVVEELLKQLSKKDEKRFSNITIITHPTTSCVQQGGIYETNIYVGTYDSERRFTATINGQQLTSNENGRIHYRTICNKPGEQRLVGTVYVQGQNGWKEYPFREVYYVKPNGR